MTLLFTWLWQGLAVAVLTTLVVRALSRLNAATRYVMWWAALVTILGIPLALTADTFRAGDARLALPGSINRLEAAVVLPAVPEWVGLMCAAAWMLVALSAILRVTHGWFVVRSLRHRSKAFDPAREARLPLWANARAFASRRARLRTSDELSGACAIGFRRPVILVGRQLADALDDEALDQIVMHEQAHLARHDDWLRLVQAVIEAVAGPHPAVWWLSRRIDLDREAACDDYVVARTGAARQYASALLAAATTAGCPPAPAIAPGATAGASALRVRVLRLLDPRRARGVRPTPIATMAMAFPVVAVVLCPQLAPLVVFVEAVEHVLPLSGASVLQGSMAAAIAPGLERSDVASSVRVQASAGQWRGPGNPSERPEGRARVAQSVVTPAVSGEHAPGIEPALPAPLQGRPVTTGVNALAPAAPAGTMASHGLPETRERAPWQALATSSAGAAKSTASGVASGAQKGGVAIGRAFTRAAQAIAAGF